MSSCLRIASRCGVVPYQEACPKYNLRQPGTGCSSGWLAEGFATMQIVQACERVLQTEDVRSSASPDAHVSTMQLRSQV